MKVLLCIAAVLACSALTGCESDLPPDRNSAGRFQRGISGGGQLVQPDYSDDPIIRESTRLGY
jgi:hypothetical protein